MIRMILTRTLLFALPFVLYFAWLVLVRIRPMTARSRTPWTALIAAGLFLVAASFLYVGLTEGEPTSGVYVAAHVENGKIVPGHVETSR